MPLYWILRPQYSTFVKWPSIFRISLKTIEKFVKKILERNHHLNLCYKLLSHLYQKIGNFFNKLNEPKYHRISHLQANSQRTYILNLLEVLQFSGGTTHCIRAVNCEQRQYCMVLEQPFVSLERAAVFVCFHSHTETGFKNFIVLMLQY